MVGVELVYGEEAQQDGQEGCGAVLDVTGLCCGGASPARENEVVEWHGGWSWGLCQLIEQYDWAS